MARPFLVAAALLCAGTAQAHAQTAPVPPPAPEAAMDMSHHGPKLYTFTTAEVDYARVGGKDVVNWDAEGWVGGDVHKLWWRSEGETQGSRFEKAEVQALYSRNVATFFDVQGGLRYDIEPDSRGYAVAGVQGLSPYFFETQAHVFVGFKGDALVRLRQTFDLRMTNRFVIEPMLETDIYLTNVPERGIASGFSTIETGVMARYEITRKVAPYVGLIYERRLGGTARLAEAAGEDAGGWSVRGGLRFWF